MVTGPRKAQEISAHVKALQIYFGKIGPKLSPSACKNLERFRDHNCFLFALSQGAVGQEEKENLKFGNKNLGEQYGKSYEIFFRGTVPPV